MQITLSQAGKRFNNNWVFKNISQAILPNTACSITGANGAGKSTLLQILMGYTSLTLGQLQWHYNNTNINPENIYKYLSFCSPAMMLLTEFTAAEIINFNAAVKPMHTNNITEILQAVNLQKAQNQYIKNFSSGMLQRLKLALAFYTNTPLLLLDEPTANLDQQGKTIYKNLIQNHLGKRTIIIASNDALEYDFCTQNIAIL